MSATHRRTGSAKIPAIFAAVAALGLGGTGLWLFNGGNEAAEVEDLPRYEVRRGKLRITLKQIGTFEAEEAVKVRAEIRGRARIIWLVDEGARVKKGDILVELDKTDVETEIESLTAQVDKARANLVVAQADEEIRRLESESKLDKAQMDLENAIHEMKKFKEGTQPKEVRDAEIKIKQAHVKYQQDKAIYDQMIKMEMLEKGFVTKEEVDQSRLDVETARTAWQTAMLEKEILTDYTHPMRLKQLEADRTRALADIERYKQETRRREAQTRAATTQREQELARVERRLKEAEERYEKMTIRAESNGIVVYGSGVSRWWRPEEIKVGAEAHRHQILMRLPNLETMQLIVKIHEADIGKVRVDKEDPQPVIITTDSLPGQSFEGYVKKVDTLAQSDWGRQHVKRFSTTIALEEQIPGVRPGMTGTAEILVEERNDVLYVPVQVVETRRGSSYCHVIESDGEVSRRAVTLGASSNTHVEIKDGLEEGEVVTIRPSMGGESAADAKPERKRRPVRRRKAR
jgi:multidrug efflux pump subunit AcrA (membrane-fusion protein)